MQPPDSQNHVAVALAHAVTYEDQQLRQKIFSILETAKLQITAGHKILVKPNLLMARKLACTDPRVTATVAEWLLEKGANVSVSDCPGFGRVSTVANAIGLDAALQPLGLKVKNMGKPQNVELSTAKTNKKIIIKIASDALECDKIISVARVKAHAQMRMTLCVKNCFGCVPGLSKAFIHAKYGEEVNIFADIMAGIWDALPPVAGVADGITAMHKTGPSKGSPYHLGLLGACNYAPCLDITILNILNIPSSSVPLALAIDTKKMSLPEHSKMITFPLDKPESFTAPDFIVPAKLVSASFNPARLAWSCIKRIWKAWKNQP